MRGGPWRAVSAGCKSECGKHRGRRWTTTGAWDGRLQAQRTRQADEQPAPWVRSSGARSCVDADGSQPGMPRDQIGQRVRTDSGARARIPTATASMFFLLQQIDQMRDQRHVRRRHRVVAQLAGAHPGESLAFRGRPRCLPSAGRRRAASADGNRHRRGWRRSAARGTPPSPRCRAPRAIRGSGPASGRSPGSTLPPGNSHRPASDLPAGRCAISTRLSASMSAQATTSDEFHERIIAVDGDVFLGRGRRSAPGRGPCRARARP